VAVRGELDVYTAPRLREALDGVIDDGALHIVIDVRDMTFVDSTGLSVIVGALKRVRDRGGELSLNSPTSATEKVLEVTGLDQVMTVSRD
jgi:anti-sigma B factor antagonist